MDPEAADVMTARAVGANAAGAVAAEGLKGAAAQTECEGTARTSPPRDVSPEGDRDNADPEARYREDGEGCEVHRVCVICLDEATDVTYLPCSHPFCFACILQWSELSRKCPLCVAEFRFAMRNVEGRGVRHDFPADDKQKPAGSTGNSSSSSSSSSSAGAGAAARRTRRPRPGGRFSRWRHRTVDPWPSRADQEEDRAYDRMVALRRQVYRYKLRAKHMGANRRSGYSSVVFPELVRSNVDFVARLIPWIRRELQAILQEEDVETVRAFVIAVARSHDLQSERAISLLTDFLHDATETFVHELLCFARSPFTIKDYDKVVQYGIPLQELEKLAKSDNGRSVLVSSPSSSTTPELRRGDANGRTSRRSRSPQRRRDETGMSREEQQEHRPAPRCSWSPEPSPTSPPRRRRSST